MDYKATVLPGLIGAAMAFSASFFFFNPKIEKLQQHAEATPPIIVVDMAKLALDSVPLGASKEAMEEHFKNTQTVIDKFKAAGFLVLTNGSVISAPDELQLKGSDIPANQYLTSEKTNG